MNGVVGMKLRVSKFFKKKRNYLKLVGSIACGAYIMTGMRIGFTTLNDTIKNDYYTFVYDVDDDLIEPLLNEDYSSINTSKFAKIDVLSVDMARVGDMQFLDYCTNLEKLEIKNAQLLTDSHIDCLNQADIKEYHFFFDRNYVLGHMAEGADFSELLHPEYIKTISFMDNICQEELDSIILEKYLNSLYTLDTVDSKYNFVYSQLTDMVKNLSLDQNDSELMKFLDISNYVVDYLYYDPEIRQYLENNSDVNKFNKEYKKIKQYNQKSLTAVVGNHNSVSTPAICANYSSLLSALCIQNNIEIYRISGTLNGSNHAWNMVKFQDNYYYVDLTQLDLLDGYHNIVNNYKNELSYSNVCNLINALLIPLDSELASHYATNDNIEQMKTQMVMPAKDNNFFGTLIDSRKEIQWYLLLSSITILFALCEIAYEVDVAKGKTK